MNEWWTLLFRVLFKKVNFYIEEKFVPSQIRVKVLAGEVRNIQRKLIEREECEEIWASFMRMIRDISFKEPWRMILAKVPFKFYEEGRRRKIEVTCRHIYCLNHLSHFKFL